MKRIMVLELFIITAISGVNFMPLTIFAQDLGMDSVQQQMQNTLQGSADTAESMVNKVKDSSS